MSLFNQLPYKLTNIKKFYFLEYFIILLKSVEKSSLNIDTFKIFIELKDASFLGESRYKKTSQIKHIELSKVQMDRYRYTYKEILDEAKIYKLIENDENNVKLTTKGVELLRYYNENGINAFNEALLKIMENEFNGFHYLISTCYAVNKYKYGAIILPIYSPLKLGIEKSSIKKMSDIYNYCHVLLNQINIDLDKFNRDAVNKDLLQLANNNLIDKLVEESLISRIPDETFQNLNFIKVVKRVRDFWLNYLIRNVYNFKISLSYFELWSYRARQIGIVNTTEFYPGFSGKLIYPTSIISSKKNNTADFRKIYEYSNGDNLYIHEPESNEEYQSVFIETIFKEYLSLKTYDNSFFVNLLDLREITCYRLKISYRTFNSLLEKTYKLNIQNQLSIRISLESDKLPEENKAQYLKREPILIDNKNRNIIAISSTNKYGK